MMRVVLISLAAISSFTLFAESGSASGVSGGGGNVMYPVDPREPASPEEVRRELAKAKPKVAEYLHAKKDLYRRGQLPAEERAVLGVLFLGDRHVVKAARKTALEIANDQPCFDGERNPVDGSIHAGRDGAICLSALTISRRVERQDVPAQSAALIAHEITEVVGLGEDEAVRVQAKVLEDFRREAR